MLDWFHIAMRLNHLKQVANIISATDPGQEKAKAAIVNQVKRLCWRLWNGKVTNARGQCFQALRCSARNGPKSGGGTRRFEAAS
jgi:hypothetical protein